MITYTIVGRLIKDSESVTNSKRNISEKFTVAVNQNKDKSKLYTCYFYGERASFLHPYLIKGRQVMLMGSPYWRDYEGKEYESVNVSTLELCGTAKDSKAEAGQQPQNPDCKPFTMDGRFFDTRDELENYRALKSPDGLAGPETFDDDDIPF